MIDVYLTALAVGASGMIVMAIGGGGRGHATHGGHATHIGGGARGHLIGGARGSRLAHSGARVGGLRGTTQRLLGAALSPLTLFTVALGFGATGMIVRTLGLASLLLPVVALVGGVAFYGGVVRPMWNGLSRFASRPALTLESAVGDEVTAVTSFDKDGHGIVRLPLDGQLVDLLATLSESSTGHHVARGDVLVVTDVDPRRNRCTVAPPG